MVRLLQVLQQILHQRVQAASDVVWALRRLILQLRGPLLLLLLSLRAKVAAEFIHVFSLRLCDVRCRLLFAPVCSADGGLVEGWSLRQVRCEGTTLRARSLLGLNRAEVVASPMAPVVDKVTVAERLLEVLTSLGLEAATTILLALAGARA